jgi:hypothetical protein
VATSTELAADFGVDPGDLEVLLGLHERGEPGW